MNVLHQIVPMFFLAQFLLVLVAILTVMLAAGPEIAPPRRKSFPHVLTGGAASVGLIPRTMRRALSGPRG
jgi:hypothetical protein